MKSIADRRVADPAAAQPAPAPGPAQPDPGAAPADPADPEQQQAQAEDSGPAQPGDDIPTAAEQKAYEQVVVAGVEIMYNDKTHEQIVTQLKNGADNPAQALATLAFTITTQIDEKSGGTVPEEVLFAPAAEFIEQGGELADAVGAFPVDEALMYQAMDLAITQIAEEYDIPIEDVAAWINGLPENMVQQAVAEHEQRTGGGQAQAPAAAPVDPAAQQVPAPAPGIVSGARTATPQPAQPA